MSYDIKLFKPEPDIDPLTSAQREEEEEQQTLLELDPVQEALKLRIVTALTATNSQIQPMWPDYEKIAAHEKTTPDSARLKHRWIELNDNNDRSGIQIQLFDHEAFISVPYWHDDLQAETVFHQIWEYLRIINREAGYVAYDPQLDEILDLNQDYSESLQSYAGTRQAVADQLPGITIGDTSPKG